MRKYQVGLSVNGDYVAWSTRPNTNPAGLETLYVQRVGVDNATPVMVAVTAGSPGTGWTRRAWSTTWRRGSRGG